MLFRGKKHLQGFMVNLFLYTLKSTHDQIILEEDERFTTVNENQWRC